MNKAQKPVKCWMDPSGLVYDDSERYPFASDPDSEFLSPAVAVPLEDYVEARRDMANLEHWATQYIVAIEREFGLQPKYGSGIVGSLYAACNDARKSLTLLPEVPQ